MHDPHVLNVHGNPSMSLLPPLDAWKLEAVQAAVASADMAAGPGHLKAFP
jgi:hypothetical protein